jgi:hypothetical protein
LLVSGSGIDLLESLSVLEEVKADILENHGLSIILKSMKSNPNSKQVWTCGIATLNNILTNEERADKLLFKDLDTLEVLKYNAKKHPKWS